MDEGRAAVGRAKACACHTPVRTLLYNVHTEWGVTGNQTTSAALWNMSIRVTGAAAEGGGLVPGGLDWYSKRQCGRAGNIKSHHK